MGRLRRAFPIFKIVTHITQLSAVSALWLNSRVVRVNGPPAGGSPLDGLHGCGVQSLLLGHGPFLIAVTLGTFHLPIPLCLVDVVDPEQQAVVHDLKAFQHLSTGQVKMLVGVQRRAASNSCLKV